MRHTPHDPERIERSVGKIHCTPANRRVLIIASLPVGPTVAVAEQAQSIATKVTRINCRMALLRVASTKSR